MYGVGVNDKTGQKSDHFLKIGQGQSPRKQGKCLVNRTVKMPKMSGKYSVNWPDKGEMTQPWGLNMAK